MLGIISLQTQLKAITCTFSCDFTKTKYTNQAHTLGQLINSSQVSECDGVLHHEKKTNLIIIN